MRLSIFLLLALSATPAPGAAVEPVKLSLTSPLDYQVFQRQTATGGEIIIESTVEARRYSPLTNLDGLQARLMDPSTNARVSGQWQSLPFDNRVRRFRAELPAPAGGWYRLEVRLTGNGTNVSEVTVEHVGVGEVFAIGGQSNSANHGEGKQHAKSPLVVAFGDGHWQPAADPEPGASGKGGSFLPAFGDAMAAKFGVPIGLVPFGVGGTSVREWLPAGDPMAAPPDTGLHTILVGSNSWVSTGELFDRILNIEKEFGTNGFRALLWHQGESDCFEPADRQISTAMYRQYMQRVIESSRAVAGWRVPWFVAEVSYHSPRETGSPELRAAQKSLVSEGIAFAGPNTDELGPEFRQDNGRGIHLNPRGLQRHGELWAQLVGAWLQEQLAPKSAAK